MRNVFAATVAVAAAVVAAFAVSASGAGGEGPPCADITDAGINFPDSTTGTYTLNFLVKLKAPACIGKVSYTLFVRHGTPTTTDQATFTGYSADGYPGFTFSSPDKTVCVYAQSTYGKAGNIYDRAPDAGGTPDCLSLTAGVSGGQGGFH